MSILSRLFGSRPKRLSKLEYWAKWELNELISDIELAHNSLDQLELGNPDISSFKENLELELFDLTHDNIPDFSNVWHWFRPQGDWDQFTHSSNEELRERIYFRSNRWKTEAQE